MWFIILILIIIIVIYTNNKENFIVGYNSYTVPDNPIESIYDLETKFIQQQFDKLQSKNVSFDTLNFTLLNNNIAFGFNDIFKISILNFLKNNNFYTKDKIYIHNNLYNIYYLDKPPDKIYIFNCNLVNSTHFFTRNIKVKLQITNFNSFNSISLSQITILGILLDNNSDLKFNIPMFDELYPNYYQIKNKLHLLDPFLTSRQDLVLTPNQILNFNNILAQKTNELQNLSKQIIPMYSSKIG